MAGTGGAGIDGNQQHRRGRWADETPPCDRMQEDDDSAYADDDACWEEDADEGAEEYEASNAWEHQPSVEELKARWLHECRAVKTLEKVEKGTDAPSAALSAARGARDAAEQEWRDRLAPKPVSLRLGYAQRKLDKAQRALDKASQDLQQFEDEVKLRRDQLWEAVATAEGRRDTRQEELDALHREAGELAGDRDRAKSHNGVNKVSDMVAKDLQAIVAGETGWPAELIADRSLVTKAIEEARQVQTNLAEAAAVRLWQQYSALFAPEGSLRGAVRRLDYRAAEKIVGALAASADGSSPGTAAGQLQAALGHAGKFAETLAATLASQPVLLEQDEDRTEEWTGWDIATGQMTITTTPATRRPKPTTRQAPIGSLSTSQWQRVVEQIANAPPGSSQCFLAFAAVERHVEAAKDYLSSLSPSDDTSGTGDASYPLPADGFAALLAGLPADDGPWRVGIERELRAADALANGLRALSERRNLAAAGHIDRLLKQFGHSMVVESLRGTP